MTVVITGTSRGFGAVMAQELMLRGYSVMCASREPNGQAAYEELVNDAKRELEYRHDGVKAKTGLEPDWVSDLPAQLSHGFFPLDLSDDGSIKGFCDYIKENADQTQMYLFNNAAVSHRGYTTENLSKCMQTNFWGTVKLTENLVPLMAPGSRIFQVLCTGVQPRVGVDLAPYAISKSILFMYTSLRWKEFKKREIYMNGICPGVMDTGLLMYPGAGRNPYYSFSPIADFIEFERLPNQAAFRWYRNNREYPYGRYFTSTTLYPLEDAIKAEGPSGGVKSSAFVDLTRDFEKREDWRLKFIKERQAAQNDGSLLERLKGFFI